MKRQLSEKAPRTYETTDYPPIDCSNDIVMVKEGLRRPKLQIDRNVFKANRTEVKEAKMEWRTYMRRKFKNFRAKQRSTYDLNKGAILLN